MPINIRAILITIIIIIIITASTSSPIINHFRLLYTVNTHTAELEQEC